MATKFKKLKEQLATLEEGGALAHSRLSRKGKTWGLNTPSWIRYLLFITFLSSFFIYAGNKYLNTAPSAPVEELSGWVNQQDDEILSEMGAKMDEMGYSNLSHDQLVSLRQQGVTATFISRMRDLGYTGLTLDDLIRLRQNDVSSTFAAMMKELGYDLSIDDLIQLRRHDITAYYTSRIHDLGYKDITKDALIRLKDTGVEIPEVEQFIQGKTPLPDIDELIRHHISNQ